jgi:hypothetical protein
MLGLPFLPPDIFNVRFLIKVAGSVDPLHDMDI